MFYNKKTKISNKENLHQASNYISNTFRYAKKTYRPKRARRAKNLEIQGKNSRRNGYGTNRNRENARKMKMSMVI